MQYLSESFIVLISLSLLIDCVFIVFVLEFNLGCSTERMSGGVVDFNLGNVIFPIFKKNKKIRFLRFVL
jgi:hypothetical protein